MRKKRLSLVLVGFALLAPALLATATEQGGYRVGTGDVLSVKVWGFDDLSQTVVVSEEGVFSFPLVTQVACNGLTPSQIESRLEDLLADGYLKDPQVTVIVLEYHSKKVNVLGEVEKPGTYALKGPTTLLEVLSMSGGVTNKAGSKLVLFREDENASGTQKADPVTIDLDRLLSGTSLEGLFVEGGETIIVPESEFFFVLGEVNKPGAFTLDKDVTVLQAVTMAGGFTARASTKKIKVIREIEGKKVEERVSHDSLVQALDTIVVPESFF